MSLDDLVNGVRADYRRDRWARPLIMQPDGAHKAYIRASNATKILDDTFNLDRWHWRNIAYGMAHDASLVARLLAIGGTPATWNQDEKKAVLKVVEDANACAQAHKGADIGTAVHRIIERLNRGEAIAAGPYQPDVDAYRAALASAGLTILPDYLEVHMVCDELELAGTADNIVAVTTDTGQTSHRIADLKTGATVEYGALGFAGQLAAYAHGVLYDVETEHRLPTPMIRHDVGYIIHLPAGQGRCTVYEIDLAAGWEAAKVAAEGRRIQKAAKRWLSPMIQAPLENQCLTPPVPTSTRSEKSSNDSSSQPAESITSSGSTLSEKESETPCGSTGTFHPDRVTLIDRTRTLVDAGHGVHLSYVWPEGVPGFKADHDHTADELTRILSAVRQVEDEHDMPWHPMDTPQIAGEVNGERLSAGRVVSRSVADHPPGNDPSDIASAPPPHPRTVASSPVPIDEGADLDDDAYELLRQRHHALDKADLVRLEQLSAEAAAAGLPISLRVLRSVRRWEIARALILWCENGWDDDVIRDLVASIVDSDHPRHPATPLGAVLGALTISEAQCFGELAQRVADGAALDHSADRWRLAGV